MLFGAMLRIATAPTFRVLFGAMLRIATAPTFCMLFGAVLRIATAPTFGGSSVAGMIFDKIFKFSFVERYLLGTWYFTIF